jgi:hypothetical protein
MPLHTVSLTATRSPAGAGLEVKLEEDSVELPDFAIGMLFLGGVPFHVEAVAVHTTDGVLVARNSDYQRQVDQLLALCEARPWLVEFDARRWLLYVTPFEE